MYLKCHRRFNDGKEHRYWSIAEKRRVSARRTVDRHVLYLGEINDSQRAAWLKSIEAFDETRGSQRKLAVFPSDRAVPEHAEECGVQVKLKEFNAAPPPPVGCVLGVLPALGTARDGGVLAAAARRFTRGDELVSRADAAGGIPPDRSGQRVAIAPGVV